MSNEYQITGQVSASTVKQNMRRSKVDYTPIYNALKKLEKGKALVIQVTSQSQCSILRKAVERHSKKYQCSQKQVKEGYNLFISKKEDLQ